MRRVRRGGGASRRLDDLPRPASIGAARGFDPLDETSAARRFREVPPDVPGLKSRQSNASRISPIHPINAEIDCSGCGFNCCWPRHSGDESLAGRMWMSLWGTSRFPPAFTPATCSRHFDSDNSADVAVPPFDIAMMAGVATRGDHWQASRPVTSWQIAPLGVPAKFRPHTPSDRSPSQSPPPSGRIAEFMLKVLCRRRGHMSASRCLLECGNKLALLLSCYDRGRVGCVLSASPARFRRPPADAGPARARR